MRISVRSLTRCVVQDGGERSSLRLVDESGEPIELDVSASDANAIATTLPLMLKGPMQDHRRQVMPLEGWRIEPTSDGSRIMMTFTADDGFEVCFSAEPEACVSLVSALNTVPGEVGVTSLPDLSMQTFR